MMSLGLYINALQMAKHRDNLCPVPTLNRLVALFFKVEEPIGVHVYFSMHVVTTIHIGNG